MGKKKKIDLNRMFVQLNAEFFYRTPNRSSKTQNGPNRQVQEGTHVGTSSSSV